jgi:hypothetical protein
MLRTLITGALAGLLSTAAAMAQTLSPPNITAPAEGSMTVNFAVYWQGVQGAAHYDICVAEQVAGGCVLEKKNHTGTNYLTPVPDTLRGKRLWVSVRACPSAGCTNDTNYGIARSFYAMGPVVQLQEPADASSYASTDRRPTFSWAAYTAFSATSQPGTLKYKLTITGTGAAATVFDNLTTTSFKPPTALSSLYQNPIRWGVQACTTVNCSASGGTRTLTLAAAAAPTPWGPVVLSSPANNTTVDTGAKLRWQNLANAATYRVCLNNQPSGCRVLRDVTATSAQPELELKADILDMRENPNNPAYVFRNAAGSPSLKTMYWSVTACNAGNTQCTSPGTTPQQRTVLVANASAVTTPPPTSTLPTLSFATHLYPIISTPTCSVCHLGTAAYPQKLGPSNLPISALDENTVSIPFSTADGAATMRTKFLGLAARSGNAQYTKAYGKVYVVPGNSNSSGLHWKAQDSTAPAFGNPIAISGQTKPLREWITIWINQGAAP